MFIEYYHEDGNVYTGIKTREHPETKLTKASIDIVFWKGGLNYEPIAKERVLNGNKDIPGTWGSPSPILTGNDKAKKNVH